MQKYMIFRGAMLGMAVGDAMGYTVDRASLTQIRDDYGPNGLMGYDLVNGCAEVVKVDVFFISVCHQDRSRTA